MKSFILTLVLLLLSANASIAESYNYITTEQMKKNLTTGEDIIIVDIQVKDEFDKHHLPGSIATYAYPVKTDAERSAIDPAIDEYQKTGNPVVIVCPRGKGGAKRCYDYMMSRNVPQDKLTILEKGMAGWPHKDLVEGK